MCRWCCSTPPSITPGSSDQGAAGIEGTFNPGSLIFDVWIEHAKVGIWVNPGNGLYVSAVRVRDVFADGVHFHGGTTNSTADQTQVRNTGDDELALDSENGFVTDCALNLNTVQSPIQANGIGVYGGANNAVRGNQVSDTVAFGSGITISTAFGGGFTGPTTVAANKNNTMNNATYQGLLLSYAKQISNLTLDHLAINGTGTYGIDINDVTGSMTANYVTVAGATYGGLNNPGNYTIDRGPGDSGF